MLFLSSILSSVVAGSLFFHSLPAESTGINVRTICQDSQGRLWFGGNDGITCYDGCRYNDFRYNTGKSRIGDDYIYKMLVDSSGTVWAAGISGLSSIDARNESSRSFPSPGGTIRDMAELPGGRFLLTVDHRLWTFDRTNGSFSRESIPIILRDCHVNTLYAPGDTLYIGTSDGRVISVSKWLSEVKDVFSGAGCQINCILKGEGESFWIGTEGDGLMKITAGGEAPVRYGMDYVRSLCMDEDGALWIGTKNGLGILKDGEISTFQHDYYNLGSITHNSVLEIFRDQQGTMWLGTFYGGACYCASIPSFFTGMVARPGAGQLNGQIISDIAEGPDGSVWIGTNSGGLNILRKDGKFEHIGGLGQSLSDQPDIKSIYISSYSGRIYVGTDKNGISILRPGHKIFEPMKAITATASYAMDGTPEGIIYFGTSEGLRRLDETTGAVASVPVSGINSNITALKLDSKGIVWLGQKLGLVAYDSVKKEDVPLAEELASIRYVEDIFEDSSGRLWISANEGLFCYDGTSTRKYTIEDGLPNQVVRGVEEDSNRHLWISTNNGLCRLDADTGECWVFTMADGLPGNRFTAYAHCHTRGGDMIFGGLSWVVRFNPEAVTTSYKEVAPVISGIEVNGQRRYVEGDDIELKARERDVRILFSAPDYISGEDGHFFYTLTGEGIKDSWHEAGADRTASYHGLVPGKYIFHLGYRNSAGIKNPEDVLFGFSIPPFWYETVFFKVLASLLLSLLVIGVFIKLLSRKQEQFRSEMERVRNELLNELSLEFVKLGAGKSPDKESSVAKVFYKGDEDFMRKAMQVVKKNLDNAGFTVEDLASEMNMSRSNLHLRFKALFGVSAHEFIKTVRFNEACRLLLEKKYSMSEIGYMVGFTTPSYFAAAFRRFLGCTPSDYLRQHSK